MIFDLITKVTLLIIGILIALTNGYGITEENKVIKFFIWFNYEVEVRINTKITSVQINKYLL